jgi:diaminohydroxyphosphoribosylaminopyrimidine deaminase/5-amino-6-(5-phosphoribosylamino)uracil reductase
VRIVLDSRLRLPLTSKLVAGARQTPLWVVTGADAPREREQALLAAGVEMMRVPSQDGRLDLTAVPKAVAGLGITRLMVETGPILAAAFLRADLVDEVALFQAPQAIGADGIDALDGLPLAAISHSPRFRSTGHEIVWPDTVETFERA